MVKKRAKATGKRGPGTLFFDLSLFFLAGYMDDFSCLYWFCCVCCKYAFLRTCRALPTSSNFNSMVSPSLIILASSKSTKTRVSRCDQIVRDLHSLSSWLLDIKVVLRRRILIEVLLFNMFKLFLFLLLISLVLLFLLLLFLLFFSLVMSIWSWIVVLLVRCG